MIKIIIAKYTQFICFLYIKFVFVKRPSTKIPVPITYFELFKNIIIFIPIRTVLQKKKNKQTNNLYEILMKADIAKVKPFFKSLSWDVSLAAKITAYIFMFYVRIALILFSYYMVGIFFIITYHLFLLLYAIFLIIRYKIQHSCTLYNAIKPFAIVLITSNCESLSIYKYINL
jgi:hypothetical protein